MKTLFILISCVWTVWAQYEDSPFPQRLNIPGAVQLGQRPSGFRQGRVQNSPLPVPARIRRPGANRASFKSVDAAPRPQIQSIQETAKPVTEEPEDEEQAINTPTPFVSSISPLFSTQQDDDLFAFLNSSPQSSQPPQNTPVQQYQTTPPSIKIESTRQPQPYRPLNILPSLQFPTARPEPQRPQPVRLQPLSYRPKPQFRPESRPQFEEEDEEPAQPIRQYNRPPEQQIVRQPPVRNAQPVQKLQSSSSLREKKPVAQVLRKYREDNPDGSITWGFENDDGSFKEEVIGVDCVTRGKYGYVDPDGLKREYSYETGNPCDKTEEQELEKGFIDYQENKAVLPNGVTIDLANMGKKSKRPFRQAINH